MDGFSRVVYAKVIYFESSFLLATVFRGGSHA